MLANSRRQTSEDEEARDEADGDANVYAKCYAQWQRRWPITASYTLYVAVAFLVIFAFMAILRVGL